MVAAISFKASAESCNKSVSHFISKAWLINIKTEQSYKGLNEFKS
jgi:hypothetical protein